MRSTDLFGFFLLFLLDFWRPTEAQCSIENFTIATCHSLKDIKNIKSEDIVTLKTTVAENILTPILLQNLTSLKHLDLSKGNLSKISPGTFLHLSQLHSLNLAENHIKQLNSSSLEGLKKLRTLSLKKNNIRHLPDALLNLKNLKFLDITRNHIDCNCATLKVRDKLVEKGVKLSKRAICSGPLGVKGWSLLKPSSELVCTFEEQDEGMQKDQPDGLEEFGSGDEDVIDDDDGEFEDVETPPIAPEITETPAPETPVPFTTEAETPAPKPTEPSITETTIEITQPTQETTTKSLEKPKLKIDDGLFFDSEEKSSTETSTNPTETTNKVDLFLNEGSGDDDEGSGTLTPPIDFTKKREEESVFKDLNFDKDPTNNCSLFDTIFGSCGETTSTKAPKFADIENEEFMPVVPDEESDVDVMPTKSDKISEKSNIDKTVVVKNNEIPIKDGETKQELADASQEAKTGNAPMVVLIVLLGIFIALIVLAAYKGDFCKKKRVPDDVERGTELKEMRKSLLESGGNAVQPKMINGNAENVPLIKVPLQTDDKEKVVLNRNGNGVKETSSPIDESSVTDQLDPVKPPRKSISQDEVQPSTNGKSHQNPEKFKIPPLNLSQNEIKAPPNTPMTDIGSPPLSPDAQRVKIILQENPDSVPKTPILITRTKMGENLVKTP
ncbi:protein windpipe [Leptopilina boulardi]|uniref:protein windpipe n=1 Tax=Leptopilina boulardi TaxID=63433 RepID=UPI0021F5090B|nr:protein windpipe [Leptopilina boulardi]XP_051170694.1 protein windpipe [Leptopilina boulardi]XP_051170695.1 protein windpipe [Leptopilina boulardi]